MPRLTEIDFAFLNLVGIIAASIVIVRVVSMITGIWCDRPVINTRDDDEEATDDGI